jgi:acyl carrier protein
MVFEKIKALVAEQLGIEEDTITLDTKFIEDLQADSLDLFQIISDIEDAFDISVDNIETIKTVGEAVAYVEANKK